MSLHRLFSVYVADLRHHAKRPLFWILLLMLAVQFWFISRTQPQWAGSTDVGGVKIHLNSEFALADLFSQFFMVFYAFFIAVAAGLGVIQDEESKVGEVLHATPLRPSEYLWGKFLAVATAFLGVLLLQILIAFLLLQVFPAPDMAEYLGPFRWRNYFRGIPYLALPNLIFLAGVSFAVGERTRKPVLVFLLPVAFFLLGIFFLWSWSPTWLPLKWNRLLMWLDPSGGRWFTETWNKPDRGAAFYNTQAIVYDLPFLLSRAFWALVGLGAMGWSLRGFARGLRGAHAKAADVDRALQAGRSDEVLALPSSQPLADLAMTAKPVGFWAGTGSVAAFELRGLLSQPGMYLFVPLILLIVVSNTTLAYGPMGTPLLLTPGTMAVRVFGMLTTLVCFLLLFYCTESLNREANCHLDGIASSTPLPSGSVLLGKALANGVTGAVVVVAAFLGCAVILLVQKTVPLKVGPFLLVWGALMLPTFLAWAAFVNAVQSLTRNRYGTYVIGLATLGFTGFCLSKGWVNWAGNWPLWNALIWSDMGAFELDRASLFLNRAMVLAFAGFFIFVATHFHARKEPDATATLNRLRGKSLLRGFARVGAFASPALVLLLVLVARVNAGYQSKAEEKRGLDYWKKNINTYKDYPKPLIEHVDLVLDLEPAGRSFRLEGTYQLRNHLDKPLAKLPVSLPTDVRNFQDMEWTLDGAKIKPEDRAGLVVFTPVGGSLQPGQKLKLGFRYRGVVLGGSSKNGGGASYFILPSGVVLGDWIFAPSLGFNDAVGLDKEHKPDPKDWPEDWHQGRTPGLFGNDAPFTTRLRISVPEAYQVNSVGSRMEDRVEGGKRHTLWVSDYPVSGITLAAGKWAVRKGQDTAIYYHPGHAYNLDEMMQALDGARKHYSEWFYPYPWKELKLSEFPGLAGYAQGFTTNITFSEQIGFLTKNEPKANAAFMVTAHEAAHQWWGNLLSPGKGPNANILSEGLAEFSTALLAQKIKGEAQRIGFMKEMEQSYTDRRRTDNERPLVKLDGSRPGDQVLTYEKSGWAFLMLADLMGREACLRGLHDFIEHYLTDPDRPALEDFLPFLRRYAPDPSAYDAFTQQWFREVVLPQFKIEHATRTRRPDGAWDVKFRITNAGTGRMPLAVAVANGDRLLEGKDASQPDRLNPEYQEQRSQITLGPGEGRELAVVTPFEPNRILPDPDVKVLQLRRKEALHKF